MLAGPSLRPDPATHAYRQDLADVALAGQVIASHYAEPLARTLRTATALRTAPGDAGETLAELGQGDPFLLLDDTLGWAWGYGGAGRLVGYVPSGALGLPG